MNSTNAAQQLIVLVLHDRALLSALAGRLSLNGESLVSFCIPPDAAMLARVPPRSVLIIESESMDCPLLTPHDGERWDLVLVIGERAGDDEHMVKVPAGGALAVIPQAFAGWRAATRG